MSRIKEIIHCLQLDSRIRHNIRYAQREWFISYFKHFRKDLRGIVSIDKISNIYQKDTAKEIQITLLADKVKVKLPNGEIKDISEM